MPVKFKGSPVLDGGTTARFLPVQEGIFILPEAGEKGGPRLLGGYCRACNRYHFPRERHCHRCLGPVEAADLGNTGVIYSYTAVRAKPPLGLPQPYGVGFVDLAANGLRVFALLDPDCIEDFKIGALVTLAVKPLGHDGKGHPCLRPYFTLQQNQAEGEE